MAPYAARADLAGVAGIAVTLAALGNPRHQDVAAALGALGGVVARSARLGDMGSVIEAGARHPVLRQPHGGNLPLIESGSSQHTGDVMTVDADPFLEQIAGHFQRLTVRPVTRAALLVDPHLPGSLPR